MKKSNAEVERVNMNFKQKLLEVLIQICWIPISAGINALTLSLFLSKLGVLFESLVLSYLKGCDDSTEEYQVDPKITISTYEGFDGSVKANVEYDDGKRTTMSEAYALAWPISIFALPLRCISLILSIFALFIPRLNIKIKNNRGGFLGLALDVRQNIYRRVEDLQDKQEA